MSGQGLNSISRLSLLPWPYHDDSLRTSVIKVNIFEQNGLKTRGFWGVHSSVPEICVVDPAGFVQWFHRCFQKRVCWCFRYAIVAFKNKSSLPPPPANIWHLKNHSTQSWKWGKAVIGILCKRGSWLKCSVWFFLISYWVVYSFNF